MSGHTPGPWEARPPNTADMFNGTVWSVGTKPEGFIAILPSADTETNRANARLIATAPELLEGAKDLLDVMLERDQGGYKPETKKIDEANLRWAVLKLAATIDKAEGRL